MEEVNIPNNKPSDYLDYLLGGAELNDSLLQAYRNFHLTLQSIFVAIGAGLSVAVLAFNELIRSTLATLILVVLGIISHAVKIGLDFFSISKPPLCPPLRLV